ncbi:MAG: gamma-glutamylcyclotransferase [Mangrovicoccus sp.]|nr:gamma-glutamylcyclotransferase [Mangrovicoccus sp.]
MSGKYVFGYGSLVNPRFHTGRAMHGARLSGWQREWRQTSLREVPFLSVRRAEGAVLTGMIAEVPHDHWPGLDEREYAYDRHPAKPEAAGHSTPPDTQIYAVKPHHHDDEAKGPILLSYLDVVVQGYLRVFGQQGVSEFFDSTEGWDRALRDDRAAPIYSRYEALPAREQDLVDRHLARLGVTRITALD